MILMMTFVASAEPFKCTGFTEGWYTTRDGCPVIKRSKALANASDSTATHCTYSAIIGNASYSQYDSAQSSNEASTLKRYASYVPDVERVFKNVFGKTQLANGQFVLACKNFENKDEGLKWCKCKFDGLIHFLSHSIDQVNFLTKIQACVAKHTTALQLASLSWNKKSITIH
ncbi:MAG: hypothetical protein IPO40_22295 [Fibrobacteres bacterium]|nr:hypothetical protein [Fibrobacterota bacterium]